MAVARVLLVSSPPAAAVEKRVSFDVDECEHVLELGLGLVPALGPGPGLVPGLEPEPALERVLADGVEAVAVAANVAQDVAGQK